MFNTLFLLTISINFNIVFLQQTIQYSSQHTDPRQRTIIMRLDPVYLFIYLFKFKNYLFKI
jgi:hypothetical protein